MGLDDAYQEAMADKVKVVGKVKVSWFSSNFLMVLFIWAKLEGVLTISWWWMLLALLA